MMNQKTADKTSAIFVDDGGEDAYEFASNYIWFDPRDAGDTQRAWSEARALWHDRRSRLPAGSPYEIEAPRLHGTESALEPVLLYLQSA